MMITNHPDIAAYAVGSGVDRIFVDLESIGKQQRQGHLDTVISRHSLEDVARVRPNVPEGCLLVRINPVHRGTPAEIETAIDNGADMLMLPMFRSSDEVRTCLDVIERRVPLIPLAENREACACFEAVVALDAINEIYIGLNDLALDRGDSFMFEALADGTVDRLAAAALANGVSFGFGGVARIGEGDLPAELILSEHVRLGSSSVILSRTFHRRAASMDEVLASGDLGSEVGRIRSTLDELSLLPESQLQQRHELLRERVRAIAAALPVRSKG